MDYSADEVTWWPAICGQRNIYDAYWSYSLTINTTNPDLSNCFQNTALLWTSTLILLVSSVLYIPFVEPALENKTYRLIGKGRTLRLLVTILLTLLALAQLIFAFVKQYDNKDSTTVVPAEYIAAILRLAVYAYLVALERRFYDQGIHSASIIFVYWFVSLLFGIVTFRSKIIQDIAGYPIDWFDFVTFYVQFGLELIAFLSTLFPGKRSLTPYNGFRASDERTPLLQEDETSETRNLCPKLSASFLSVLTFTWFTRRILLGYKRPLNQNDIWELRREDSCQEILPTFEKHWNKELKKIKPKDKQYFQNSQYQNGSVKSNGKVKDSSLPGPSDLSKNSRSKGSKSKSKTYPSLVLALVKTFGTITVTSGFLLLGYYLTSLINPLILQLLIGFVEARDPYDWRGYVYAVTMFCCSIMAVLFMHHAMNLNYALGMRIRTALTSSIYKKAMRLSPTSKKTATVGEIVNLMSVDTQKLQDAPMFVNYIWGSPILVVLCMYFLWQILGPSCLTGLGFMLIVLPVNSIFMAKKIRDLQKKQMKLKDNRIKLMNQVLGGIKVLKLYAWEPHFEKKILGYRSQELLNLKKGAILGALTYIIWFCSPFIVALLCFMTYVLSDPTNVLDAQTAFVAMSLINLMSFPLTILPVAIMFFVQAMVSLKRISRFLQAEDLDDNNVQQDFKEESVIKVSDGTFSWGEESRVPLHHIDMGVARGKLVAVVGQVGSGKSSLLSAILGEMIKLNGTVNVLGTQAYVSQQAWIQNMTLKDNVLFSKTCVEDKYQDVIERCALKPDIKILPAGDGTEIGERGINLSGGQKARVSLARAVYQDSDIYLLDDPLSAVDAHVGKHIFEKVIGPGGILQNKTRILVTNQLQFLPQVDEIIVMKEGTVGERGSYEQLLENNGAFAEFIRQFLKETVDEEEDEETKEELLKLEKQISKIGSYKSDGSSVETSVKSGSIKRKKRSRKSTHHRHTSTVEGKVAGEKKKKNVLIKEEATEEGNVKASVIMEYLRSASFNHGLVVIFSLLMFIASQVGTNIWLSEWSSDLPVNGTSDPDLVNLRLGVYGGLGACQTLSVMGISLGIALGSVSASKKLHLKLLTNILKCPMSFFDTTPLGRIVNRFSKDIDTIDANIPQFSQNFMTTLAPLISTFIMIIYSTPIFTAVFVPLAILFFILQRVYVKCARQLKRLDAVKRSPIYAFFSESLNGVSSIRAYKQQNRFISHLEKLLNENQRVWFEVFSSNRWIGIHAEVLGDFVILFAAIFAVLQKDTLNPGLVGLSISFSLQVSLNLVMTVRSSCELETYIIAVERIKEYSEIQTEAPWDIPSNRPARTWPDQGLVKFKNYQTKYRAELELVLKDVTCVIQPVERVGIVGRTGAGKSSMTLSLFRIIEACGGSIEIDGVNIADIGLHSLRSKLSIIPQDPVLFSGSLRFNIDPASYYADIEVWQALEHAHLKDFVSTLPGNLEYECGEDGDNLSVGQKQLVCLARALLRKSKILVLDEATASIDLETDELIQSTIRTEFENCTVITIAHRLNTIMDYDRVIVMAGGEVKEFDTPNSLLKNSESLFFAMAKDANLVS